MTQEILIKGNGDNEDDYIEVEFEGDCHWENDGIGSYEYWGFKGYDKGHDYVECENVTWNEKLYSPEVNAIITKFLADNNDAIYRACEEEYK